MMFRKAEFHEAPIKTLFRKDELRASLTAKSATRGTRPSEKGVLWHEGNQ
jgi:hypothetical protein